MKSFFSIILPTYNQSDFLRKSIDSIVSQTFVNWELLVIDNNSTDETDNVIRSFQDNRIKVYKINNQNILAKSRNLGIKKSTSTWLCFIDSDDIWYPKKLEITKKYIETENGDLFYHDLNFINKKFFFIKKKIHDKSKKITNPVLKYFAYNGNGVGQSSVVVKKEILEKIGLVSESKDKFSWEDFDTWIRIAQLTNNFIRIPKTLASIWVGPGNISNLDRAIINNLKIKKYYNKIFYEIIDEKDKNKKLWWIEYPSILHRFKKGKYDKCLYQISNLTNSPLKIKIRINYIKYFSYIKKFINNIRKVSTVILIFKNKSHNLDKKITKMVTYKVIQNESNFKDLKFDNFKFPVSFKSRMKKKDVFHLLHEQQELICYGWSSSRDNFFISEINKKIKNSGNLIFYDFKTLISFRKKGYYQALLKEMLNNNIDKNCYIYTTFTNKRSIFSILKSGFRFFKFILIFNKNLILK